MSFEFNGSNLYFGLVIAKGWTKIKIMKQKILFTLSLLFTSTLVFSQNVEDNKISFKYIRLPYQRIDAAFKTYEVRFEHSYKTANEDSLKMFDVRKELAQKQYADQYKLWSDQKFLIDKNYLTQLAQYEKTVNAGGTATAPNAPLYPTAPQFIPIQAPQMHTEITDDAVYGANVKLDGFEKGLGGSMLTIDIMPIRSYKIVETKKGTGASTKYEYYCQYVMPVGVKMETPTQGALMNKTILEGVRTYQMKSFSSKYEYQLWYMENSAKFFLELEAEARRSAMAEVNTLINNEFGYTMLSHTAEMYAMNRYKDYDYSDVTIAYTYTTQALILVERERDRSSAKEKLDQAINAWKAILTESNLSDDKARINDKVTAMIQCNLAELYGWRGDYDQAELYKNLALNSGVNKFRNHAERVQGFYADQKKRWVVHF